MKEILYTTFNGGFPLTTNDLGKMELTSKENDYSILQAITPTTNWILYGMGYQSISGTVSSGSFVHIGEIYTTTNYLTGIGDINNIWIVSDYSYDSNGIKTFKDSVNHDTWQIRGCKYIEQVATPSGYDWYVKYVNIQDYNFKRALTDRIFDEDEYFFSEMALEHDPNWTNLVYGSGYSDIGSNPLRYSLDALGNVNIKGSISTTTMPKDGYISANTVFTLPSEIIPNDSFDALVKMNYLKNYDTTYYEDAIGNIILTNTGACYLTCYNTVGNTGTVYSTVINISYKLD